MKDDKIKVSDWKALDAIEDVIQDYHHGDMGGVASVALIKIIDILTHAGWLKAKDLHCDD